MPSEPEIQFEINYGDANYPLILKGDKHCTISKIYSMIKEELPYLPLDDMVLTIGNKVARHDWTLRYLLESYSIQGKISFILRYKIEGDEESYNMGQVMTELQIEEAGELKKLLAEKPMGAFYADGDIKFKKEKVQEFKEFKMDLPTMVMNNPPLPTSLAEKQTEQQSSKIQTPQAEPQPAKNPPPQTIKVEIDAGSAHGPLGLMRSPDETVQDLCQFLKTRYPRLSKSFLELRVRDKVVEDTWTLRFIIYTFSLSPKDFVPFTLKVLQYDPKKKKKKEPPAVASPVASPQTPSKEAHKERPKDVRVEVTYFSDAPPLVINLSQYDTIEKVTKELRSSIPALAEESFDIFVGEDKSKIDWTLRYLLETYNFCHTTKIPLTVKSIKEKEEPKLIPVISEEDVSINLDSNAKRLINLYFKFTAENYKRANLGYTDIFFENFETDTKADPSTTVEIDTFNQCASGDNGVYIARQTLNGTTSIVKGIWETTGDGNIQCFVSTDDGENKTELVKSDVETTIMDGIGSQLYVEVKFTDSITLNYLVIILKP